MAVVKFKVSRISRLVENRMEISQGWSQRFALSVAVRGICYVSFASFDSVWFNGGADGMFSKLYSRAYERNECLKMFASFPSRV